MSSEASMRLSLMKKHKRELLWNFLDSKKRVKECRLRRKRNTWGNLSLLYPSSDNESDACRKPKLLRGDTTKMKALRSFFFSKCVKFELLGVWFVSFSSLIWAFRAFMKLKTGVWQRIVQLYLKGILILSHAKNVVISMQLVRYLSALSHAATSD